MPAGSLLASPTFGVPAAVLATVGGATVPTEPTEPIELTELTGLAGPLELGGPDSAPEQPANGISARTPTRAAFVQNGERAGIPSP